jgi:ketosteroid isomerase-like protein
MSQENVELSNAWVDAFNRRDLDALDRLHGDEIAWKTTPEDPDAATHRGRDAVRRYIEGYIEAFPDLRIDVTECFSISDGRIFNTSRFLGQSAQGIPMEWSLTLVSTIEDRKFVCAEEYFSRADAAKAVGLAE